MKKPITFAFTLLCACLLSSFVFADVAAGPMYLMMGAVLIIPAILVIAIVIMIAAFLYKIIKANKKDK